MAAMKISGWGRFPTALARICSPSSAGTLRSCLDTPGTEIPFDGIARGQGRSYGDSALAGRVVQTSNLDSLLAFDDVSGILHCRSGVTLGEILRLLAPRGWFLPVLPGTQHVSVGGAIASDVHGKNHHRDGSFCDHLQSLDLLLPSGEILRCSRTDQPALFHATCGGMGLTGIIVEAALQLRRVQGPEIVQRVRVSRCLDECFEQIESHADAHYSVAWLDCMARGASMGRSVLFTGEHADSGQPASQHGTPGADPRPRRLPLSVPLNAPAALLNRHSIGAFNAAYHALHRRRKDAHARGQRLHYQQYFFPLDAIAHWNRLYGRRGFLQYQCVLPTAASLAGITRVLQLVNAAGKGSFLSVLKKFGPANGNLLSFPMAGYTLTLDFKFENDLLPLLTTLDDTVLDHGGRLYLAKDARMSAETFRRCYPRWQELRTLRAEIGADRMFNSLQSRRLGL
jgi:decaprenylphospho-beta-D-ribofuranose 2-oxidase